VAGLLAVPHRVLPAVAGRDRDQLKAIAAGIAFEGRSVAEVSALGVEFADMVIADRLRPDVMARFEEYRTAGARTVIVSASFELYLTPIGERIGADAVLGTRLESRDGRFTGRLEGRNCRAAEKVSRFEAWLGSQSLHRSDLSMHAFGDSNGDLDLLRVADRAWWAAGRTLTPWSAP
jgi:phosphatidylglycerophosphatase C